MDYATFCDTDASNCVTSDLHVSEGKGLCRLGGSGSRPPEKCDIHYRDSESAT